MRYKEKVERQIDSVQRAYIHMVYDAIIEHSSVAERAASATMPLALDAYNQAGTIAPKQLAQAFDTAHEMRISTFDALRRQYPYINIAALLKEKGIRQYEKPTLPKPPSSPLWAMD